MKPVVTKTMLVPRYLAHFQCLGEQCPSTCCAGWRVSIDKRTYQHYKRCTDKVVAPILKMSLQRNRQAGSTQEHGQIKLAPQGGCPLQDEKGLCQVHKRLGEAALSDTCQVYPRMTRQFAGQYEQVLTLSCPEAARLALTSEDAFEFEALPMAARAHTILPFRKTGINDESLFAARAWVMQLLHTETLHIGDRLAILGLYCDQLESLVGQQKSDQIDALNAQMTATVESGAIQATLAALPRDEALQATLFAQFLCERKFGSQSAKVNELFAEVILGLGADRNRQTVLADLVAHYRQGLAWLDQSQDFNAVMSRYFLNETVREAFPWQDGSPVEQYRRWVVHYGMLRVMLAGYANRRQRPLEAGDMAEVVWAFSRSFLHNPGFAKGVAEILERCRWNSLPQWLAVLK